MSDAYVYEYVERYKEDVRCPHSYKPYTCPACKTDTVAYGVFTVYKEEFKLTCPYCEIRMMVLCDHFGGGSHYWGYKCVECEKTFEFDTHAFHLRENIYGRNNKLTQKDHGRRDRPKMKRMT